MIVYLTEEQWVHQARHIAKLFVDDIAIQTVNGAWRPPEEQHLYAYVLFLNGVKTMCVSLNAGHHTVYQTTQVLPDSHAKRAFSRALYDCFAKLCHCRPAWGILVGVRPTKLVHAMLDSGMHGADIRNSLRDEFYVAAEKIDLLIDICQRERDIIDSVKPNSISIYVGIPFCPTRCTYCSFAAIACQRQSLIIDNYLSALHKELKAVSQTVQNQLVDTLYIGGGTPAMLSHTQIIKLMTLIRTHFDTTALRELTFEAGRPELIDDQLVKMLSRIGVERICINPQTMRDQTLTFIGRHHSTADTKRAFAAADRSDMIVNSDVIAGLPTENLSDFKHSLDALITLAPDNITVHTLAIKRGSQLATEAIKTDAIALNSTVQQLAYAQQALRRAGYRPYYMYRQKYMVANLENVGYAKPNTENIYNVLMMSERQTILAFGAGATSKFLAADGTLTRVHNVKDITAYCQRIDDMIERKVTVMHTKKPD